MKNIVMRGIGTVSLALGTVALSAAAASADPANPDPKPELPGELNDKLNSGLSLLMAVGVFAVVAGVLLAAILMAISNGQGSGRDHSARLGFVVVACVLLGSAAALTTFLIA